MMDLVIYSHRTLSLSEVYQMSFQMRELYTQQFKEYQDKKGGVISPFGVE